MPKLVHEDTKFVYTECYVRATGDMWTRVDDEVLYLTEMLR